MSIHELDVTYQRRSRLRAMQFMALGFFGAALVMFVASRMLHGTHPAWGYVGAFSEAAMVGALADWFAVVALFRYPMGVPIPHTAIIPRSKERIAESLAEFVRDHFLSHDKVICMLNQFNVAEHLAQWLNQSHNPKRFVNEAKVWVVGLLTQLDDAHISAMLFDMVNAQAKRWDAAQGLSDFLDLLTKDNRHQDLFNAGLQKVATQIDTPQVRERIGQEINDMLLASYPKIYTVANTMLVSSSMESVTQLLGQSLTDALMTRINGALNDPDHPWRREYDDWMSDHMIHLRGDRKLQASFNQVKDRLVEDPMVRCYLATLWQDIKARLTDDLTSDQSTLCNYLAEALQGMGARLVNDPELRESVNQYFYVALGQTTDHLRHGVTDHISSTIKAWDDRELVEQIELNVGPDLQFIRINGTLVGGMVGLLIYAVAQHLLP